MYNKTQIEFSIFEADISKIQLRMPEMEKTLISKVFLQCSGARRKI